MKKHKTKVSDRYFNYIYVRAGAYTFIRKRQEDDIWRNLYELPLVETQQEVAEADFYRLPQLQNLIAEGESPLFRLLHRGVKHVLSHRVIWANFYEVVLPEETRSFSSFLRIRQDELDSYPVSRLVSLFLEKMH